MTEFTADGIDRTTTLKVSGLTCGHCVAHVTEELEALNGVKNVSALLNKGELPKVIDSGFAWYDKTNIDNPEIKANLYE